MFPPLTCLLQSPVLEIKLFYREEVTPADYNPRHYSDATNDNHLFFEDQPTKVPLGRLVTVSMH